MAKGLRLRNIPMILAGFRAWFFSGVPKDEAIMMSYSLYLWALPRTSNDPQKALNSPHPPGTPRHTCPTRLPTLPLSPATVSQGLSGPLNPKPQSRNPKP